MKIATVGKGGSGKTTIAGTLARIYADEGLPILAIDGDPNPNLALTLGMTRDDADRISYIPSSLMKIAGSADGVAILELTLSRDEVMRQFAAKAARNVDLLVMGQRMDSTVPMVKLSTRRPTHHRCPAGHRHGEAQQQRERRLAVRQPQRQAAGRGEQQQADEAQVHR